MKAFKTGLVVRDPVSRAARILLVLGLVFAGTGVAVVLMLGDRFLGIALLVVGAFLMFVPLSRPSLDED